MHMFYIAHVVPHFHYFNCGPATVERFGEARPFVGIVVCRSRWRHFEVPVNFRYILIFEFSITLVAAYA